MSSQTLLLLALVHDMKTDAHEDQNRCVRVRFGEHTRTILCVHLTVHLSAIRLRKKMPRPTKLRVPSYPLVPSLGLVSCIILMFSLPQESWIAEAAAMAVSVVLYRAFTG
jgi:hypothetical protein